ncbi:MAG: shikimate kinase [Cytophagales bacterium]|nr:MAG: shikimate kinase [Cytophagales bacterium]TAF59604.1 MAG: shikimate kinase [Cytophagales bacterium]
MLKKIFLVGMPTSGKSSIGPPLSRRLSLDFMDLDKLIEHQVGCSISNYFKAFGEASFRELEKITLKEVIHAKEQFVLACGGGTPCYADNMDVMCQNGVVVFLDPPIQHIVSRLYTGRRSRPIFDDVSSEFFVKKVLKLYEERLVCYQKAHIRVRTIRNSSTYIAQQIEDFYQKAESNKPDEI